MKVFLGPTLNRFLVLFRKLLDLLVGIHGCINSSYPAHAFAERLHSNRNIFNAGRIVGLLIIYDDWRADFLLSRFWAEWFRIWPQGNRQVSVIIVKDLKTVHSHFVKIIHQGFSQKIYPRASCIIGSAFFLRVKLANVVRVDYFSVGLPL